MATWVDFKDIKQRARIADVLARYGVLEKLQRRGDDLIGPGPIHKGTNATQFHVSLTKNNFNCFGDCHEGRNVIDFVAKMEGVDTRAAALKLQGWCGIGDREEKQNGKKRLATKDKPDKATGEGKREQNDERVQEERVKRFSGPVRGRAPLGAIRPRRSILPRDRKGMPQHVRRDVWREFFIE